MTKAQLVEEVRKLTGYSTTTVSTIFEAVLESITDALSSGEDVVLRNFGTFTTQYRAPRVGRNPQTGEVIPIEAQRIPVFNPSSALKSNIKRGISDDECNH